MTLTEKLANKVIKNKFARFLLDGFGYIYLLGQFQHGNNIISVRSDLWVIIGDGESSDMLPLNFCSEGFIEEVARQMGWMANEQ